MSDTPEIGSYTDSGSLGIDPVSEAELIKEAARINPMTGRLPEDEGDNSCDHCTENEWTFLVTFTPIAVDRALDGRMRRLCDECVKTVLEWI